MMFFAGLFVDQWQESASQMMWNIFSSEPRAK
ncbi:hypothetical protein SVI_3822 [Shewanella violacea DSS12]|uniref:Uncharacterized protein n=1 Tax=Shewanella violacea (strain JCM 10179 / CIP 106290 / LMG 19151 / DSS12) TaxID=637905 RepID=D4ZCP8_SHEVD|nr:hypothetical protein SVI_3822 [Shewanella violacea DSS12]